MIHRESLVISNFIGVPFEIFFESKGWQDGIVKES